jgi:hypothetical protein
MCLITTCACAHLSCLQGRSVLQAWIGGEAADAFFSVFLTIRSFPHLSCLQGRTVLWAWMQEKQQLRPAGTYDSACCLCVPRMLFLSPDGARLLQEPLPELPALRHQHAAWHVGPSGSGRGCSAAGLSSAADAFQAPLALLPGVPLQLGSSSSSSHVDVEVTLTRGEAESVVLLLQPFEGLPGAAGAGIAYCWTTDTLQVRRHAAFQGMHN